MELKRKQEEEDRKKREAEERAIQVWTTLKCYIFIIWSNVVLISTTCLKPGIEI